MSDTRPLLVGLNNPDASDPRLALYPSPVGSTGHRIVTLMRLVDPAFTKVQYLDAFERTNLWPERKLPSGLGRAKQMRAAGEDILHQAFGRTDAVIFGEEAWDSIIRRPAPEFFGMLVLNSMTRFWRFPHPSPQNTMFRDAEVRKRFGTLLLSIARNEVGDFGLAV